MTSRRRTSSKDKVIGRGGNGVVYGHKDKAEKVLRFSPSREQLARFKTEIEAMTLAQEHGISGVVPILQAHLERNPPSYTMPLYQGDLDCILPRTKHNARATAYFMLPLVRTLRDLAAAPRPIFHRDLKPSNILYRKVPDGLELHLADFGCAFIASASDARLTKAWRAVGATFFRPPEYSYGRVEEVQASGDVFAVGKLLWYVCNGVQGEVFPYTLWYPDTYNLTKRVVGPEAAFLNHLVARCAHIAPDRRPSYDTVIGDLQALAEGVSHVTDNDGVSRMQVLEQETRSEAVRAEKSERFVLLIERVRADLAHLESRLKALYPGTKLVEHVRALSIQGETPASLVHSIFVLHTERPLTFWRFPGGSFDAKVMPPILTHRGDPLRDEPIVKISIKLVDVHREWTLVIGDVNGRIELRTAHGETAGYTTDEYSTKTFVGRVLLLLNEMSR